MHPIYMSCENIAQHGYASVYLFTCRKLFEYNNLAMVFRLGAHDLKHPLLFTSSGSEFFFASVDDS